LKRIEKESNEKEREKQRSFGPNKNLKSKKKIDFEAF
jgi:hypothetical protein